MNREWNGSEVMEEYARIASDQGLVSTALLAPEKDARKPVGNPDKVPATPTRNEKTEHYDVKPEGADSDLVQKAHPKDARPADAMGDGGLVENISQQQEKDIDVATSMPHGMLLGKHAAMVRTLVKLANALENNGNSKAAKRVDDTLRRVARIPFAEGLRKEAIAFLPLIGAALKGLFTLKGMAVAGGVASGWSMFADRLTSTQEDLNTDIQDLLEVAASAAEDRPAMAPIQQRLQTLLRPYVAKFRRPLPLQGSESEMSDYFQTLTRFRSQVLPEVQQLVTALTASGDPWYKLGVGAQNRLKAKLADLEKSTAAKMTELQALANIGRRSEDTAQAVPGYGREVPGSVPTPSADVGTAQLAVGLKGVQQFLNRRGLKVPVTGELDDVTRRALRFLEQKLEISLAPILERKGWSVKGMILKPDGTVMSPETLRELLSLADKAAAQ